ncbi:hypothetical protein OKW24_003525 [Peribacillus simplex]|nr:hypothetical protein [Peribacillus simplex]
MIKPVVLSRTFLEIKWFYASVVEDQEEPEDRLSKQLIQE